MGHGKIALIIVFFPAAVSRLDIDVQDVQALFASD
jgi:hypothetical protein